MYSISRRKSSLNPDNKNPRDNHQLQQTTPISTEKDKKFTENQKSDQVEKIV